MSAARPSKTAGWSPCSKDLPSLTIRIRRCFNSRVEPRQKSSPSNSRADNSGQSARDEKSDVGRVSMSTAATLSCCNSASSESLSVAGPENRDSWSSAHQRAVWRPSAFDQEDCVHRTRHQPRRALTQSMIDSSQPGWVMLLLTAHDATLYSEHLVQTCCRLQDTTEPITLYTAWQQGTSRPQGKRNTDMMQEHPAVAPGGVPT